MQFVLKNTWGEKVASLMRRAGYRFQAMDQENVELVFVRPISGPAYPRFHIYLRENKETDEIFFNLHLDQKKPSYQGAPRHSADYESEVVRQEAARIKSAIINQ